MSFILSILLTLVLLPCPAAAVTPAGEVAPAAALLPTGAVAPTGAEESDAPAERVVLTIDR